MFRSLLSTAPYSLDLGLLLARIVSGGSLLMYHGLPKLLNFSERKDSFGDPLGIGSTMSLVGTVGAEFFCAALLVLGAYTRIALLPLIFTFGVIIFIVHGDDPWKERELAVFFLTTYVALFFTGPGKYSVDSMMKR